MPQHHGESWQQNDSELLRLLLENVQCGVVACDASGALNLFNGVARELHGLPRQPITAAERAIPAKDWPRHFHLYRPDGQTLMEPAEVPLYRAFCGEPVVDVEMVIRPPGLPPRTVQSSGQVFYDASGHQLGAVVSMQDISARKAAEADLQRAQENLEQRVQQRTMELARVNSALRQSEDKWRLLVDTIPQLAWMARPDGSIFWYNRRWYEYTGTKPQRVEGWGWQSVVDPECLPMVMERWKASLASGTAFDTVVSIKGADQTYRPFLSRANPLRDREGRVLFWFGTCTDIAAQIEIEEALRDADRRKDEFLATLAHELRNPLAPLRNTLEILKMPGLDAQTVRDSRDLMERQVQHLVRLVDDLLDVSRVMRGKIELRKEPVSLATIVSRAVETAKPLIDALGHRLELLVPPEPVVLDADPIRLAQVIGNLLTNAAKYTEPGGRIELSVVRDGDHAVVRVRDNGIGIDAETLPHIFALFVQVDHAATRSQGGLGIGLTLVQNLVEMHGGQVQAFSDGLGTGCEVVVRLPVLTQPVQLPLEEPSSRRQSLAAASRRLLVVDDNRDAANTLAMWLRMQGHDVQVAHSGDFAIQLAEVHRPEMIFLDIGMPGMDGYEVARQIRQMPGLSAVVLTALTGWGQLEDRRRSAAAGFDHHLVKPPEPKVVERLLANLATGTSA